MTTFVAVAETGSIKISAARVGRSSAAVSMQMKRLEGIVGAPLFRRGGGAMRVSETGERLLPHARGILAAHDAALETLRMRAVAGPVRIGLSTEYGKARLMEALTGFAQVHPQAAVDLEIDESHVLAERLAADSLDLAVLTPGGLVSLEPSDQLLFEEPLVWAAPKVGLPVADGALALAASGEVCPWRRAALDALDQAGRRYRVAYRSSSLDAQLAAVAAGLAVAAIPASRVTSAVRAVAPADGLPALPFTRILLRVGSNPAPAARAAAERIRVEFGQTAGAARGAD